MFSNKIAFNRGNFFLLFFMHFTLFSAHLIGQDVITTLVASTSTMTSGTSITVPLGEPVTFTAQVSPPTDGREFFMIINAAGMRLPVVPPIVPKSGIVSFQTQPGDLIIGENTVTATLFPFDLAVKTAISNAITVTVTIPPPVSLPPPILLPPPRHLQGIQKVKGRSSSSSHSSSHTNVVNILTWKAPKGDIPVAYRIFRSVNNRNTKLIAEVPGTGKLEFKDHQVKEGSVYTYSVVSVSASGNVSEPALVTIK